MAIETLQHCTTMDDTDRIPTTLSGEMVPVHHSGSCLSPRTEQSGDMVTQPHDEPLKSEQHASEQDRDKEISIQALFRQIEWMLDHWEQRESNILALRAELTRVKDEQRKEREEEKQRWIVLETQDRARIKARLDGPARNTRSAKRKSGE